MNISKRSQNPVSNLLASPDIRRVIYDDVTYYSAVDLVRHLAGSTEPEELWHDLQQREPALATLGEKLEYPTPDGEVLLLDMLSLEQVLRLIQALPSAKSESLKRWLARSGRQRLEEMENPELAILRTRKAYERSGYNKRWIDKRLRGISARHELTGEWFKRGATESEQYRGLTNQLMESAFGMDVETYRRYKNLSRSGQNLRDHMNDLELVLTMLGETAAVALHRDRNSQGFDQLLADARDAGEIAARTKEDIEHRGGRRIVRAA